MPARTGGLERIAPMIRTLERYRALSEAKHCGVRVDLNRRLLGRTGFRWIVVGGWVSQSARSKANPEAVESCGPEECGYRRISRQHQSALVAKRRDRIDVCRTVGREEYSHQCH